MPEDRYTPDSPDLARNKYAALFRKNGATEDDKRQAAASLATSKIDKSIRETFRTYPGPLDPAQAAHLVGLVLMACGSQDGQAVARLERAVREAVYVTPSATADDRARLAKRIVGEEG